MKSFILQRFGSVETHLVPVFVVGCGEPRVGRNEGKGIDGVITHGVVFAFLADGQIFYCLFRIIHLP